MCISNPPRRPFVIGSVKDSYAVESFAAGGLMNDLPSSAISL